MLRNLLKLIGASFLVAVFVYSLYVFHLDLLGRTFVEGFNLGTKQCPQQTSYEEQEQYEGV